MHVFCKSIWTQPLSKLHFYESLYQTSFSFPSAILSLCSDCDKQCSFLMFLVINFFIFLMFIFHLRHHHHCPHLGLYILIFWKEGIPATAFLARPTNIIAFLATYARLRPQHDYYHHNPQKYGDSVYILLLRNEDSTRNNCRLLSTSNFARFGPLCSEHGLDKDKGVWVLAGRGKMTNNILGVNLGRWLWLLWTLSEWWW